MPQPLSTVKDLASFHLAGPGQRPVAHNEHLACLAMEGIASWGQVEFQLLHLYMELAGGQRGDAAAVYLALKGDGPKDAAVLALAKLKFDDEMLRVFCALFKLRDRYAGDRHKLAHWVWGYSPDLADALLLADPRVIGVLDFRSIDQRHMFVYREPDFEIIIGNNEKLASWLFILWQILECRAPKDEALQRLLAEPEIADILARWDRVQQTRPSEAG